MGFHNNNPKIQRYINASGDAAFNVTIQTVEGYKGSYDYIVNVEEIKGLVQRVIDSLYEPLAGNPLVFDILGKATVPGSEMLYICHYVVTIVLAEPSQKEGGNPFYNIEQSRSGISEKRHICRYVNFQPLRHRHLSDDKIAMLNEEAQDLHINRYSVRVRFMNSNEEGHPIAFTSDLDNLREMTNQYIFPDVTPCDRVFYAQVNIGDIVSYAEITMTYQCEEVYIAPEELTSPDDINQRVMDFREMIDDLSRKGVFQDL